MFFSCLSSKRKEHGGAFWNRFGFQNNQKKQKHTQHTNQKGPKTHPKLTPTPKKQPTPKSTNQTPKNQPTPKKPTNPKTNSQNKKHNHVILLAIQGSGSTSGFLERSSPAQGERGETRGLSWCFCNGVFVAFLLGASIFLVFFLV